MRRWLTALIALQFLVCASLAGAEGAQRAAVLPTDEVPAAAADCGAAAPEASLGLMTDLPLELPEVLQLRSAAGSHGGARLAPAHSVAAQRPAPALGGPRRPPRLHA